ncbi:hypothetical protein HMPREF1983_00447, partial [Gemella bergeri ATCC 700627]
FLSVRFFVEPLFFAIIAKTVLFVLGSVSNTGHEKKIYTLTILYLSIILQ